MGKPNRSLIICWSVLAALVVGVFAAISPNNIPTGPGRSLANSHPSTIRERIQFVIDNTVVATAFVPECIISSKTDIALSIPILSSTIWALGFLSALLSGSRKVRIFSWVWFALTTICVLIGLIFVLMLIQAGGAHT